MDCLKEGSLQTVAGGNGDSTVMQVLGLMVMAYPVVPLGLLQLRCLQWWFTRWHMRHLVTIPLSVQGNL